MTSIAEIHVGSVLLTKLDHEDGGQLLEDPSM